MLGGSRRRTPDPDAVDGVGTVTVESPALVDGVGGSASGSEQLESKMMKAIPTEPI